MTRALSASLVCAALAMTLGLAPAAFAQEQLPGYVPGRLETSMVGFEARMEEFGVRAEAIAGDESLSEDEREARILALWAEYGPEVTEVSLAAAEFGLQTGGTIMSNMNLDAVVQTSLATADIDGQIADALAEVDIDAEVGRALEEADIEAALADGVELETLPRDAQAD